MADDYAKRLSIGQMECAALVADVAGAYMSEKSSSSLPSFQSCEYLNVSICPVTVPGNVSTLCCIHNILLWWEIFAMITYYGLRLVLSACKLDQFSCN